MDLSFSRHYALRVFCNCVLSSFVIAATPLCFSAASGAELVPDSSDSAETVPSEADAAKILDEAYECLKAGQKDSGQELVDGLTKSWRAVHASDSVQLRQLDVWVTAFQNLKQLSPSELKEYDSARTEADEIAELVHKMNGRKLPHGPTLEEAEDEVKHIEEVAKRCLGIASQTAANQRSLGMVYACRRDWQGAQVVLENALDSQIPDLPGSDRDNHITLQWLAWVLMMQDEDFPRQEEYLNSVIEYAEANQDKKSNRYWAERAMTLLAESKYRSGDLAEADRLFEEVRQRLPETPIPCRESKCMGACYVSWCLAWCERHKARQLIVEQKYWDAFRAIDSAVDRLKTGGQRDLNLGVTFEDLHCLKAEALCSLGHTDWADTEMSFANAIAKHAADLRGDVHEPLAGPCQDEADVASAFRYTKLVPEVVCLRNHEGLAVASTVTNGEPKELTEDTSEEPSRTMSVADVRGGKREATGKAKPLDTSRRQTAVNSEEDLGNSDVSQEHSPGDNGLERITDDVELHLILGDFESALDAASKLADTLKAARGDEYPDTTATFRMVDILHALKELTHEDQQTFCEAMGTLKEGVRELNHAKGSTFPSFKSITMAMERMEAAYEGFASLPKPACEFRVNCDYHLAWAHCLLRNWSEAESLLDGIVRRAGRRNFLVTSSSAARPLLAYSLVRQRKSHERVQEIADTQLALLAIYSPFKMRQAEKKTLWLLRADVHASRGEWCRAGAICDELRRILDEDDWTYGFCLVHCDRYRARQLLDSDELIDACELIEDAYPRMLLHGQLAFNYAFEVEQTLRLRAEIYERLGRTKDAEADIAYADSVAAHAARLRKMCSADPEQRDKWLARKLDIPKIETCEEQNGKKKNSPNCQWPFDSNAAATGSYFTPQTSPSPRGQQHQMNY